MELIADGLLIATALTAGMYCLVLGRRLRRLNDSGAGIGARIAALDSALAETRVALAETREGVSELRSSARIAAAKLAEQTAEGDAVAARIARDIDAAREIMQRLYEAGDRVEAHTTRPGADVTRSEVPAAGAGPRAGGGDRAAAPEPPGPGHAAAADLIDTALAEEFAAAAGAEAVMPGSAAVSDTGTRVRRRIVLPEREPVLPVGGAAHDDADAGGAGSAAPGRVIGVLKAERMML